MSKSKIKIYGELYNDTPNGYVTTSDQILDKIRNKTQEEINQELYDKDYSQLSNKPSINGYELNGDMNTSQLGINIPTKTSDLVNDSGFLTTETEFNSSPAKTITSENIIDWNGKQDKLISGENIATINGKSLLSGENIVISEGSGTTDYTQLTNKPSINGTTLDGNIDLATPSDLEDKQDELVSGTNIKTINNQSILGSGNINIKNCDDTIFLTCSSEADVTNKVILEGADNYELSKRIRLLIKMTNTNTAQEVTLSINNTDPKPLLYGEAPVTQDNTWEAGDVLDVYYDGISYQAYPTNQPKISLVGNILIISGKQFSLTPVSYYYVGWTNLSRSDFRELSEEQVKSYLSGRYNTSNDSTFSGTFGDNSLFMLAYKSRYDIDEILFTSGGITMPQNLQTDSTAEHDDITIDGQTYHIWGISHPGFAAYDQYDSVEIIFR